MLTFLRRSARDAASSALFAAPRVAAAAGAARPALVAVAAGILMGLLLLTLTVHDSDGVDVCVNLSPVGSPIRRDSLLCTSLAVS